MNYVSLDPLDPRAAKARAMYIEVGEKTRLLEEDIYLKSWDENKEIFSPINESHELSAKGYYDLVLDYFVPIYFFVLIFYWLDKSFLLSIVP